MISDPSGLHPPEQPKPPYTLYTFGCYILFMIVAVVAVAAFGPLKTLAIGIGVPVFIALVYSLFPDNTQYRPPDDPRSLSEYARSREPNTATPVWRQAPEEFSLGILDAVGKPPRPPMPTHAITAAENAGCDYHTSVTLALDVGLLVYSGESDKPAVYREAPIPDTASYVQPFAEVWLEEPLQGGTVRLMLLDPDGTLRFVSEAVFDRNDAKGSGRHTVLSPTRLPVGDHLPVQRDGWRLKVEVRGKCVADHVVNWYTPGSANALVEHMATDGELTVDLAALVEQVALTPLSLDELLGGPKPTNAGSHG
jgi:hypothetical protein